MRVQNLLLKAETLDLVKVLAGLKRNDVVCADADHGLLAGVASCVERESCLSRDHLRYQKQTINK